MKELQIILNLNIILIIIINYFSYWEKYFYNCKSIIKGDLKCEISAASILQISL